MGSVLITSSGGLMHNCDSGFEHLLIFFCLIVCGHLGRAEGSS